ncbi:MAG: hypothetical protein JXB10_00145 [Pirellulales bacterium]|nr:hypothetical protein [Pirellulales bacterium]
MTNAPAWVPPTMSGAAQPGLISTPGQPSTTNYAGSLDTGTPPPANQPAASVLPGSSSGTLPLSPNPAAAPNFNYSPPSGGSWSPLGAGMAGSYCPPANSSRSLRPFFSGGVPDRRTLPVSTAIPRPLDNPGA